MCGWGFAGFFVGGWGDGGVWLGCGWWVVFEEL